MATTEHRARRIALMSCGAAIAVVLFATREAPRLSPDSVTYLAAASHLRAGQGVADLTGLPLTVFPPMYPMLLAPGGASLGWAAAVNAISLAICAWLFFKLLERRVSPWWAAGGAWALALSHGLVRVSATVWSETPCLALSLGALVLITRPSLSRRTIVAAGMLSGLAFLTRYAAAGVMAACGVAVFVDSWLDHRSRLRATVIYSVSALSLPALWIVRNLAVSGQPLGPRFEGGSTDSVVRLVRHTVHGVGQLVATTKYSGRPAELIGTVTVAVAAILAVIGFVRRPNTAVARRVDLVVMIFGVGAFTLPAIARRFSSNDVESRVLSPMTVVLLFVATCTLQAVVRHARPLAVAAALALLPWTYIGVDQARVFPKLGSTGWRTIFSPALHDAIDALPADAVVLTNNPWGVWWQNRREPTLFAFTRPRPGNSHYPLTDTETLHRACAGSAYLAWFETLQNAGDGPAERRPELAGLVTLDPTAIVRNGTLFALSPIDSANCPDP